MLVARALRQPAGDARRMLAQIAVAVGGLALSVVGVVCRELAVRAWLRHLALGVGVVLVAGLLALRHHLAANVLPSVPREDVALATSLREWTHDLVWLAVAVAYAAATVEVLPSPGDGVQHARSAGNAVRAHDADAASTRPDSSLNRDGT